MKVTYEFDNGTVIVVEAKTLTTTTTTDPTTTDPTTTDDNDAPTWANRAQAYAERGIDLWSFPRFDGGGRSGSRRNGGRKPRRFERRRISAAALFDLDI